MPEGNTFYEIAAILGLAALLGALGQKLKQPLIIMFLAAGILAGPAGLGIIVSHDNIELMAHIGIALLLFIVGLKLDIKLIRTTGVVALATGLGQIIFTSAIGFLIALAFDMTIISAAYVAVALTFSSTIIIVKLLSDKKEIDSLHGQIAIGFLIVQDIAAIAALVGLTTMGSEIPEGGSGLLTTLTVVLKGAGLLAGIALLMKFVLPVVTRRLAHSQEMLVLFAIAWAVVLGAGSELLGFTKEVGAFLAGISLASTDYRDSIGARLTSLRDFLLLFFFIDLGARLEWSAVGSQLGASAVFSLFVLIGNPLIVCIIMGVMGYRRRTGFLAGLTVAQISEFSLIVAALGMSLGHISPEIMGLITLVGVITIFLSTYLILYSAQIYSLLSGPLKIFERRNPYRESAIDSLQTASSVDIILVGLGNYGSGIAEYLLRRNKTIIGIDFDPGVLEEWRRRNISVLYGDIADPEIHEQLFYIKSEWVVSTVPVRELNVELLRVLKNREYEGKIALTAATREDAEFLEDAGAHVVLRPFSDAAEQAVDSLTHAISALPVHSEWPIAFKEIRIQSGTAFAGREVRNIPLRSATGASILALSRAGRVYFDPDPDFIIYPGDRLVVIGSPEELRQAEDLLDRMNENETDAGEEQFLLSDILVDKDSMVTGKTLSELGFRQNYGATIVGIQRGHERITAPGPTEIIQDGDRLIVIGSSKSASELRKCCSL